MLHPKAARRLRPGRVLVCTVVLVIARPGGGTPLDAPPPVSVPPQPAGRCYAAGRLAPTPRAPDRLQGSVTVATVPQFDVATTGRTLPVHARPACRPAGAPPARGPGARPDPVRRATAGRSTTRWGAAGAGA